MSRRPSFEELVRLALAGALLPAEWEHLESEACLERYVNELSRVVTEANRQIAKRRELRLDQDALDELFHIRQECQRLLPRAKAKMRNLNREMATSGDAAALRAEIHRLRAAIRRHRVASNDLGLEPESHDFELWGHVIAKSSTGTKS